MNDEIDEIVKSITYQRERAAQFTLEVEERMALKTESGIEDQAAFREAVSEVFESWAADIYRSRESN
jgi:hypothetical protein